MTEKIYLPREPTEDEKRNYKLTLQGRIIKEPEPEKNEIGGLILGVELMPWCTDCRIFTYDCDHLKKSGMKPGVQYFPIPNIDLTGKNFLRHYSERLPRPTGMAYYIEIE